MNVMIQIGDSAQHFTDYPCLPAVGQLIEMWEGTLHRVTKVVVRPNCRDVKIEVEDATPTKEVHSGGHEAGSRPAVPKVSERHQRSKSNKARRGRSSGGNSSISDVS